MFMKNLKLVLYFIGLGASLVVYAHATFTTKETVKGVQSDVKAITSSLREIRDGVVETRTDVKWIRESIRDRK